MGHSRGRTRIRRGRRRQREERQPALPLLLPEITEERIADVNIPPDNGHKAKQFAREKYARVERAIAELGINMAEAAQQTGYTDSAFSTWKKVGEAARPVVVALEAMVAVKRMREQLRHAHGVTTLLVTVTPDGTATAKRISPDATITLNGATYVRVDE